MIFVGVDPGLHGAIAVYDPKARLLGLADIPIITRVVNGKRRSVIDHEGLHKAFSACPREAVAIVEDVHAMPAQGVTSSFNFGFGCGAIAQAMTTRFNLNMLRVPPATWKKYCGLTLAPIEGETLSQRKTRSKLASCALAGKKFPWVTFDLKKDGRAEAALLAWYAYDLLR